MKWVRNWFRHSDDEEPPQELEIIVVEAEEEQETPSPTPAGYCPGCGHPIDDHPRGYGLPCDTWYS